MMRSHRIFFVGMCLLWMGDAILGVMTYVQAVGERHIIQTLSELRSAQTIIVLGASVDAQGKASDALTDRVLVGSALQQAGYAPTVLLTGDDGQFRSPEIPAMVALAKSQGVPAESIKTDGQGYRTYESCKRAKDQGIKTAVVVTQRFHLARAIYLCQSMGIEVQGVAADRQRYQRFNWFMTRDLLASVKVWLDINIFPPKPPIKVEGNLYEF